MAASNIFNKESSAKWNTLKWSRNFINYDCNVVIYHHKIKDI